MRARGIKAAMAEAMERAEPFEAQPALWPTEAGAAEFAELKRGPGRPKGAVDRSTREIRDHILRNYAHPLVFLAEAYSRPVSVLAKETGMTLAEAAEFQRKCAADLAPYVAKKMPTEINASGGPLVEVHFHDGAAQIEQNQGVMELLPVQSDEPQSDREPKPQQLPALAAKGGDNAG